MVSDLEINIKDYDYKSDKPFANGLTADVYLINYQGHEMAAKVFNLRMLSTVQRVNKLREFKKVRKMVAVEGELGYFGVLTIISP